MKRQQAKVVSGLCIAFTLFMKIYCPKCHSKSPNISKSGYFYRKSDSKYVQKFLCKVCLKNFSRATFSDCYYQKKRRINHMVRSLLCSSMSQRRIAKVLNINRKTVSRRLNFLSNVAQKKHKNSLQTVQFSKIQFDDLETFEHTKLKPVTISMAVEEDTRRIIGFKVAQIGAKGLLVEKSKLRYGKRKNNSFKARKELFQDLKNNVLPISVFKTDEHVQYSKLVRTFFPHSEHKVFKSVRGSLVGQGELKRVQFDPLFSVNHTFAMLRANINRLVRRTWCTTKKIKCLEDHLWIYIDYHNSLLI